LEKSRYYDTFAGVWEWQNNRISKKHPFSLKTASFNQFFGDFLFGFPAAAGKQSAEDDAGEEGGGCFSHMSPFV